ncbi:hypothetical protein A5676_25285 [Mycobacterium malmoense]|uniref:hypothetical protein n=1 Tax=Mycobacterium malmoense TaxID=1780 RepID=UPI00080B06E6|nr:hypothetical protein A5676_25285 [Mycobacterium malmoense]
MTQNPETSAGPTTVTDQPGDVHRSGEHSRLGQVVAWVVIVAGVVFVAAVIFFTGLFLGWSLSMDKARPPTKDVQPATTIAAAAQIDAVRSKAAAPRGRPPAG